jgi:hypothetical protein
MRQSGASHLKVIGKIESILLCRHCQVCDLHVILPRYCGVVECGKIGLETISTS